MIADGIITSSLSYAIQIYGGCSEYLLNQLQIQQNIAARYVTKLPWLTSTEDLLTQCGWLSIRQLIKYHSILQFKKILVEKEPSYIYNKVEVPTRFTRFSNGQKYRDSRSFKKTTTLKSFIPRTLSDWNKLPEEIRINDDLPSFKKQLLVHIKDNIPVK